MKGAYVAVEPHAVLEKRVGRVFDTRNHGARREGRLFDITVVVLWVLVQDQTTDLVHGEVTTRPDLGDIEGVEAELQWVGLFRLHDLYLGCPFDLLSVLNPGSEVLIELMVSSAFFLIGKDSINGGERVQSTATWPLGSYVPITYPSIDAYKRRASPSDRTSDALRTRSVASVTDGAVMMMPENMQNIYRHISWAFG